MFVISWFTSRNGVCKLLCWKEIKVEFLSLLHDPFTLIFSVNSFFWLILPRSFILFPFGCQECHKLINSLHDPSVLVTKEILMHQSIPPAPTPPPPLPPGWPPGIGIFFALDGKFPGVGSLELSNPPGCGRVLYYKLLKPTQMLRGAFTEKCALDFIGCKL